MQTRQHLFPQHRWQRLNSVLWSSKSAQRSFARNWSSLTKFGRLRLLTRSRLLGTLPPTAWKLETEMADSSMWTRSVSMICLDGSPTLQSSKTIHRLSKQYAIDSIVDGQIEHGSWP